MVGPILFFVWIVIRHQGYRNSVNCKNNLKSYTSSCEIHFKAQYSGKIIFFFFLWCCTIYLRRLTLPSRGFFFSFCSGIFVLFLPFKLGLSSFQGGPLGFCVL